MPFRVPLDRRDGGAGVKADDCAWRQQRVTLRSAPVRAVLLALLFPARKYASMTEGK